MILLGIGIRNNGSGSRVTIDGKPVTEKIELKEEFVVDMNTEKKLPNIRSDYHPTRIYVADNAIGIASFNGGLRASQEFGVYHPETNSIDFIGSANSSYIWYYEMAALIGDFMYISHNLTHKVDLINKTVTRINVSTDNIFSFKGELYGNTRNTDIHKINLNDATKTTICPNLQYWEEPSYISYETSDALYLIPDYYNDRYNGARIMKFDGKTATEISGPFGVSNGIFFHPHIVDGKAYVYGREATDDCGYFNKYLFKDGEFTLVDKVQQPYNGFQEFKGKTYATTIYKKYNFFAEVKKIYSSK